MPAHIGIIGCSAPGAALCFQTICASSGSVLGEHHHPEISMHVLNFADHVRHVRSKDWTGLGEMLLTSAQRLHAMGAEFLICPDNTAHAAYQRIAERVSIPWLHIADSVVTETLRLGIKRVAILGTSGLLASGVYPDRLKTHDIASAEPSDNESRMLDAIIFDELSKGVVSEQGVAFLQYLIGRMHAENGCAAAILACTELPLLVKGDVPLAVPVLDSTRLLAQAAVRYACKSRTED
jgi:aspartate racemase